MARTKSLSLPGLSVLFAALLCSYVAIVSANNLNRYQRMKLRMKTDNILKRYSYSPECYSGCNFRMCTGVTAYSLTKSSADNSFSGPICSKYDIPIGYISETAEAFFVKRVQGRATFIKISQFRPWGNKVKYPSAFFKVFPLYVKITEGSEEDDADERKSYWLSTGTSGLGRQTMSEYQRLALNNRCFILPIRQFQILDKYRHVVRTKRTGWGRDCIAFYTKS